MGFKASSSCFLASKGFVLSSTFAWAWIGLRFKGEGGGEVMELLEVLVVLVFRYGYIKNHKKTVKNGQARTRESEEYKKKPRIQNRSQKSQTRSQVQSQWYVKLRINAEETEGALQLGPERARVFTDLSAEEKERNAAYSKFVNNMLPEWSRFITEVKLNRGLKESNFDQLYAYLKQHEVHANENRMMMERFIQPTNDPLALVSNASVQQYPTQSSMSPQSSNQPSLVDNCQMDTGSTSTDNLIESLTNTLALLNQSFKAHLPQMNNQLRTSSNARNNATVQDGRVVVQDVRGRYNANNQGRPFQRNNAREVVGTGNVGGQNRDSDYFKDKMLLMNAHENGAVLDEEQLLFLAGEQFTNFDEDVDDLALNVDHVFEADQCDAFDSDVDEAPTTQTMFMVNLSSEDPIYDEAGPSYDSNTPFEVQDHDTFVDHMDEYHEVHEMQSDYVEDNEEHVVQSNVSSVQNDALMSILDEMHEQGVQSRSANKQVKVVNDTLTSELARYKELVGVYEQRAKFELTDRERKIDEQMRIIISDRNRKETSLKSDLFATNAIRSIFMHHEDSEGRSDHFEKGF
ncbi:hypothetical protein Tco_0369560 [Tanacetum coccineum]